MGLNSLCVLLGLAAASEAFVVPPVGRAAARSTSFRKVSSSRSSSSSRHRLAMDAGGGGDRTLRSRPIGIGSAAASTRITNQDLEAMVETNDEWIRTRTGISSRHVLKEGEDIHTLASTAAVNAVEMSGVDGSDIELVIVATSSPDDMFGDACRVAAAVGAKNAVAFDVTAACSGFLFALVTASQFLHTGTYKKALVVGADALSRWVDWQDRNTCILFGDGAGAMVLEASSDGETGASGGSGPGLLGFAMHSDGEGHDKLSMDFDGKTKSLCAGYSVTQGSYSPITMSGQDVYVFATTQVPKVLREALESANVAIEEVDWLLLHQANIRIMQSVAKKLGMSEDKIITNLAEYGNTSAASIPLALDEAVRSGKVKKGDVIACAGFGAGLSWGAAIIRWEGP